MGDHGDCPNYTKQEKKKILHILREMWLNGDSPLRRIYSSWEELETNLEITTEPTTSEIQNIKPCPNCGTKQNITIPFEGIFPYQTCKSCKNPFYVNRDLTLRKLTDEEERDLPRSWIKVVEDMNQKKVAVVFGLE